MKKYILFLVFILSCFFSFSQSIVNRSSAAVTASDVRLQAGLNLFIPRYTDTTAANLQKGIDSCGAIIFTYTGNSFWVRSCSPKSWKQATDTATLSALYLRISDTASMLSPYLRKVDTSSLSNRINTKLNITDTTAMLVPYLRKVDTASLSNRINLKLNKSDSTIYYPYASNPLHYITSAGVPTYTASSGIVLQGNNFKLVDSVSGGGTRLQWTPAKRAFRAGDALGNQWDIDSIGAHSAAFGQNTKAKGTFSFATGSSSIARGTGSVAMGDFNTAGGDASFAIGANAIANGTNAISIGSNLSSSGDNAVSIGDNDIATNNGSVAIGEGLTSSGFFSTAMGNSNIARGDNSFVNGILNYTNAYGATVVGERNDTTGYYLHNPSTSSQTDKIFVVGNGNGISPVRSTAFQVLRNGVTQLSFYKNNIAGDSVLSTDNLGNIKMALGSSFSPTYTFDRGIQNISGNIVRLVDTVNGAGNRLQWLYDKGSFLAGGVSVNQWDIGNVGNFSAAFGYDNQVVGDYCLLSGLQNSATGFYANAFGALNHSNGYGATTIGGLNTANGHNSIAMGESNIANGDNSVGMGQNTTAGGFVSMSTGEFTQAVGDYSTSMGDSTVANGRASTAMGNQSNANGDNSFSVGHLTVSNGINSIAMGNGTTTFGANAIAMGNGSIAATDNSISMGNGSTANGASSISIGYNAQGVGDYSTAIGNHSWAFGNYSNSFGDSVFINSYGGIVVGLLNDTTNYYLHDIATPASTDAIFAVGNGGGSVRSSALQILRNGYFYLPSYLNNSTEDSVLTIDYSSKKLKFKLGSSFSPVYTASSGIVLQGNNFKLQDSVSGAGTRFQWTPAKAAFRAGNVNSTQWDIGNIGTNSVAFGNSTTASGTNSVALGSNTIASGFTAMAQGSSTTASGTNSVALGSSATASGSNSTSIGTITTAIATHAIAIGTLVVAAGNESVAIGNGTYINSQGGTSIGSYNDTTGYYLNNPSTPASTNAIFSLGNGSGSGSRSNALQILRNGSLYIPAYLNSVGEDSVLTVDYSTKKLKFKAGSAFSTGWNLTGNSGTTVGTNFLGTTDNVNVIFKRNSVQSGLLNGTNTSFGVNALNPTTGGLDNTAIGVGALIANTSADDNTAIGYQALTTNTIGANNTATGMGTLRFNKTGNFNVAYGSSALTSDSTGSNNTAIGYNAGGSVVTGSSNVFVGYNAGSAETGSNQLYIANTNTSTPLIGGDFFFNTVTINGDITVVGNENSKNYWTTSSTPAIAAGTGAGTSPTVSVAGTNIDGEVTITTGTLPSLGSTIFTVTFSGSFSFPNTSSVTLTPTNSAAALLSGATMVYTTGSAGSWIVTSGTTALAGATTYTFSYHVGGR